jgi:hypothetical protein
VKKIYIVILTAVVLIHSTAFSVEVKKTGTTSSKFLSIGIGPRANAMGGAFTSIANDAEALYWNPAGIAAIYQNQALFTYTKLFADIHLNYFGLVIPVGEIGNFGISVTALSVGDMEITTEYYPERNVLCCKLCIRSVIRTPYHRCFFSWYKRQVHP